MELLVFMGFFALLAAYLPYGHIMIIVKCKLNRYA